VFDCGGTAFSQANLTPRTLPLPWTLGGGARPLLVL
jgi:hypothetical protein